jgi:hypothetical protein
VQIHPTFKAEKKKTTTTTAMRRNENKGRQAAIEKK